MLKASSSTQTCCAWSFPIKPESWSGPVEKDVFSFVTVNTFDKMLTLGKDLADDYVQDAFRE